ncbi:hypothetical protein PO377_11715 [Atlantibacter hermannii]|uniref:hypothetical protein n=1 Tax=Atlantibacter hermannii TaxID=565 RepID=UPI002FF785E3
MSTVIFSFLLCGCVISSPQKAQYKTEYSHRQDIRQHNVYKFNTKPISASGYEHWMSMVELQPFYHPQWRYGCAL